MPHRLTKNAGKLYLLHQPFHDLKWIALMESLSLNGHVEALNYASRTIIQEHGRGITRMIITKL